MYGNSDHITMKRCRHYGYTLALLRALGVVLLYVIKGKIALYYRYNSFVKKGHFVRTIF